MSQLPLFEPDSQWKAPTMDDLPTDWGNGRVGIDCETHDAHLNELGPGVRRGAYIAGISLAIEDGPSFYLPIRHEGGGNMDAGAVLRYMQDMSKTFTGSICGANLPYDLDFLAEESIVFRQAAWFRDVMIADPLINELHDSYSLEAIAGRHGLPGKDERLLDEALAAYGYKGRSKKSGIWALPARHVGPYAEQDARLPLAILRRQEKVLDDQDLMNVYNLESRVLPVLLKMRRRGVRVSTDRLDQIETWARDEQQKALDAASQYTKHKFTLEDINKTDILATALRELGVQLPKTATGRDSVTADVVNRLDHPIGQHFRRAKKMSTLRSTFVSGVRHHLTNGRIHCTFNQLRRQKDDGSNETEGAAYGRLSATNPNLQNQPARDEEIGPMWRSIYLPDGDGLWAVLDYSQQEPRQAVHFAVQAGGKAIGRAAWASAKEAARRYAEDPTTDFHQMMADMAGIPRKPAKNIYLGISYGMGGAKLCHELGLPTCWRISWVDGGRRHYKDYENEAEAKNKAQKGRQSGFDVRCYEAAGTEGQQLLNKFDSEVPFVRKMARFMQETAERQGYITTLSGRRCRFPVAADGRFDWSHKAFNRLVQGSSGDQTKEALVALDAEGFPLQLQIHDEVDFTVPDIEYAQAAAKIMRECVQLSVPMKVDVEIGPSWGEVKEI